MKKVMAFVLLITLSFVSGYTYIMAKQVNPPKIVKMNKNDSTNNRGQLPTKVEIPPEKSPVGDKKPEPPKNGQASKNSTSTQKHDQTEKKNSEEKKVSPKGYFVKVDISDQKTYVYKDGKLIRTMICSSGIEDENTKTPRGKFIINQTGYKKGDWFYSNKYQEGAKYWVGFIGGTYLFHSVPMDINKKVIQSEAEKLGTPASHGCIRLSIEDAYWFYNSIPSGTGLQIQD